MWGRRSPRRAPQADALAPAPTARTRPPPGADQRPAARAAERRRHQSLAAHLPRRDAGSPARCHPARDRGPQTGREAPMSPKAFLARIFDPAYAVATPLIGIPASQEARVLLMAIAGQESDWDARRQQGAPQLGRGFWQFESNGCSALATNATSEPKLSALLQGIEIPMVLPTIHEAIAWNDAMAVGMARLLLYCDPAPLPIVGDHE